MSRKIVSTIKAPQAIGPYSQAVHAGDFLFVSGQIALAPDTGKVVSGGIEMQAKQVMENLKSIIEAAGSSLASIAKCTIFLKDMNDFATVNAVYDSYFDDSPPARATVEVSGLPKGVDIEIDAIVYMNN